MSILADKAKVIGLKLAKEAAKDVCMELLPVALDELKVAIKGQVDDVIIEMIKAPLAAELAKLIEKMPEA